MGEWTTEDIIESCEGRMKNLKMFHEQGNVRMVRLEAEALSAATLELRERHYEMEQMGL
jgi:hypothetical protein